MRHPLLIAAAAVCLLVACEPPIGPEVASNAGSLGGASADRPPPDDQQAPPDDQQAPAADDQPPPPGVDQPPPDDQQAPPDGQRPPPGPGQPPPQADPEPPPAQAPPADGPVRAPSPPDNPTTEAKIELGRLLFWDPVLSGHGDVACATCHPPDFAYADGRPLSIGVGGRGVGPQRRRAPDTSFVGRNAQTALNTGLNGWTRPDALPDPTAAPMFWDSRARGLEEQALGPIANAVEMAGDAYPEEEAVDHVVAAVAAIPEYVDLFADAFGVPLDEAVTARHLAGAIAAFERHLSRPSSAVDRWLDGDDAALTARQQRGLATFRRVGCDRCHLGPMFSDYRLHRIGAPDNPARGEPDEGDGQRRFRTPTLRNVARTGPYMHGGALATLDDVLRFYARVGGGGPNPPPGVGPLDPLLAPLRFSPAEAADMIDFLRALSDEQVDVEVPRSVPSGLPVGGAIGAP